MINRLWIFMHLWGIRRYIKYLKQNAEPPEYCNTNSTSVCILCYCIKFEDTRCNLKIPNDMQSLLTNRRRQCEKCPKFPKGDKSFAPPIEVYKTVLIR